MSEPHSQNPGEKEMRTRDLLVTPPAALALAATTLVCMGGLPFIGLAGSLVILVIGLALTFMAISSGSHFAAVLATAYLMLPIALMLESATDQSPVGWAVAGVFFLGFLSCLQLTFATRRFGRVSDTVVANELAGLGVLGFASVVLAVLVSSLNATTLDLNWLLVPLTIGLLLVGGAGLAVAAASRTGEHDKRRWKPGERMIPPAIGAEDDPLLR